MSSSSFGGANRASPAHASLARLLRSTESPRAVASAKYVLIDGAKKDRLVAVVVSTTGFGDEAR